MGQPQTHYQILKVPKRATPEEIRKAWKKAAFEYHPDRAVSRGLSERCEKAAKRRFSKVRTAYEVLSDPTKRKEYDFSLSAAGKREKAEEARREARSRQAAERRAERERQEQEREARRRRRDLNRAKEDHRARWRAMQIRRRQAGTLLDAELEEWGWIREEIDEAKHRLARMLFGR